MASFLSRLTLFNACTHKTPKRFANILLAGSFRPKAATHSQRLKRNMFAFYIVLERIKMFIFIIKSIYMLIIEIYDTLRLKQAWRRRWNFFFRIIVWYCGWILHNIHTYAHNVEHAWCQTHSFLTICNIDSAYCLFFPYHFCRMNERNHFSNIWEM